EESDDDMGFGLFD
nr:Chain A, 60S acidic ribosomal protein P2 [synthetic construct]